MQAHNLKENPTKRIPHPHDQEIGVGEGPQILTIRNWIYENDCVPNKDPIKVSISDEEQLLFLTVS